MVRIENSPDWCAVGLKLDREVENIHPVSAMLTGHFSGRTTTPVTYTLSHPNYLFGQTTYSQTARYCPQPPEEDDDDDPPSGDPSWYDGDDDDDDEEHYCWCCFWGSCYPGCGCGCACDIGEGDDEPDEPVDPEPEDYDEASTNYPHMSGVLKIRDPLEYTAPIHLTVPLEHRNCCPCPDHATNWVSVVYKSNRLKVVDAATDMDFSSSGESLDVKIAGVSPSFAVGDAGVSFAANGDVCLECAYTVLGVGINGGYIPNVGDADLKMLNEYNSQFGLPIPINTNLWNAVELKLQTNVRLPSGNIHLGFEDSTAPFEVWIYDNWVGGFLKLASSTDGPLDISFAGWRQLVGGSSDSYSPTTWIYITAADAGKATLVYKYWGVLDGKIVEDEARQVITAIAPTIRGDVNHDGEIGDADAALQVAGVPFRFWYNDETVKGAYVGQVDNTAANSGAGKVNGKYDLINLFPLEIDVSEFDGAWGDSAQFRLCADSRGLKFCILNGLMPEDVAAMQTTAIQTDQDKPLDSASLFALDNSGTNLTSVLRSRGGKALLAFEAGSELGDWSSPRLVISLGGSDIYSYRIPLSISSVDVMYRWISLRGAESDSAMEVQFPGSCSGLPDECLSRDYVFFLHGFRVSAEKARDWNRAMFKRLWWSGSRARYCGVTWHGDDGLVNGFSYHLNAFNALKTSGALKNLVNAAPSAQSKIVIAHSLGNMVACEAIRKGMNVDKYFMLNAAVASECFDDSLQGTADNVALYVPQSWRNYPSGSWCSNWSDLFGTSDDRSNLKWKGVFADVVGLTDVYNYYSTGDEVLEADDSVTSLLSGAINWKWSTHFTWSFPFLVIDKPYDLTLERYAWQKQEILKGVDPLVATIGAGWRFDSDPHIDPDDGEFWESICTPAEAQQRLTDGSIVTNSVFGHDVPTFYQSTINAEDRYRAMAYNVPAISKPMGMAAVSRDFVDSYDMNANEDSGRIVRPNGWARTGAPYLMRWLHSDIKDMSYYFSYRVFEEIINNGGLK